MAQTKGAFGGQYSHQIIKELRAELAKKSLILAALVEHTGIQQAELQQVATEYLKRQEKALRESV
jgi:hypothetical protein